ncbi:MAG: GlsB/YeaQ/YmgE family stress response membrane protein [Candidatus Limnocylindrales bacterium]
MLFNTDPINGALDVSSIVVATIGAVIAVVVVGMVTGRGRVGRGPI